MRGLPLASTAASAVVALVSLASVAQAREPYSEWMASSMISRGSGIMTGRGDASELLQAGFTQKAFTALVSQYPNAGFTPSIQQHIERSAASVVPFVSNATRNALTYPMDRLSNGNALLTLSSTQSGGNGSFRDAANALRESIDLNRRNRFGGLWYYVYPYWSYLDGMYSLAPYYTLYTTTTQRSLANSPELDDMLYQIDLLWRRTRHQSTGLLVHGYDASLTAVWAAPVTGASPHVWGRSLGWYVMALVDTIELLPRSARKYSKPLLEKFQTLMVAVAAAVDPESGAWWQLLDQPGRERNYIESSGSAMFAYGLLKGLRLGYLSEKLIPNAEAIATRAHEYLVENFVVPEADGTISYNGTVAVCSLNSTASYEYYTGQPILYNSVLGTSAFILASLEVERLSS
jgi:rhamnogalacturonyl hydrolase YesR